MAAIDDPIKRQAIKGAIKSAQLKNESGASVLNRLKGTSLAIREQDFYRLAREVKQDVAKIQALWELPANKVITPKIAIHAKARGPYLYSYRVQAGLYGPDGNYLGDKYLTVTSKNYHTKEEVKASVNRSYFEKYGDVESYYAYDVLEAYYHGE